MSTERITNAGYVNWPSFEEIQEMFKEHFIITRREDGVVTVRMHCKGGPLIWSMELHDAIGKMWRMLGTDRETEMIIFTGTGNLWVTDFEAASWAPEGDDPGQTRYNHMFVDGRRMIITMIQDVEVPTLGVLSGSGGHTELALMCDLAIAADDIVVLDPHMLPGTNNVPGDGIHSCFMELMPPRFAAWYLMTGDKMSPEDLLRLGMVSEIVPREKLMDRAYEIADMLMAQNRVARRLTTQLVRRPWKKRIADDLDMAFGTELFGMFCADELHSELLSMIKYLGLEGKIDPPLKGKIR
ncbi:enoyl-CoA hydratase/carnithine racemase [Sedimentibacter acidaminivorans]|uniref:Enoyl-CoA hydratase/carnithine racemase n=1 Tax=Sedimentibacter acidaminivorans TaxID=913099 RepID=A0ABS4GDM9_9FIRM|nr:enoyl-CoA hydratase/isomerase family protein [Sedimentibacter acidaminivorans]MBP1925808.1 enoyl-CoA hydratase/carnithine racemase [Sedimentibacter acidaminivorans]